jgi:hypothetical protein
VGREAVKLSPVAVIADLFLFALHGVIAWGAYRLLFVDVPRERYALWPGPWSVPSITTSVILGAALVGAFAALLLLAALRDPRRRRRVRLVGLGMLGVIACAGLVSMMHFLGTAGGFG